MKGKAPMMGFGIRREARTEEHGRFHCPGCEENRPFQRKRLSYWLTLLHIPIYRSKQGEEVYVECSVCEIQFPPSVAGSEGTGLPLRPTREAAILRVLCGAHLAGGIDTETAREELRSCYRELTGGALTDDDLAVAIRRGVSDGEAAADIIARIHPLDSGTALDLVRAARRIAVADGKADPEETAYIDRLARGLGVKAP